jgi:Cu-Zn family superoxide dismutase
MLTRLLACAAPLVLSAGCANSIQFGPTDPAGVTASASSWTIYQGSPSPSDGPVSLPPDTVASGTFLPYRPGAMAITYAPAVVPPGATAALAITRTPYGMTVRLTAGGLVPRRAYGAHLHTEPCTGVPDAAGPHYQHMHDPKAGSSPPPPPDPAYANPRNEVWLDFTADATGVAGAVSEQRWAFDPGQRPRSLVLHADPTRTAVGVAGTAGARVACLTLP